MEGGGDAHCSDDEFRERSFYFHIDCGGLEEFNGLPRKEFEVFFQIASEHNAREHASRA
jgi:hypothetical protein